eukprot:4094758-Pyramimonas_sp.AAC.1
MVNYDEVSGGDPLPMGPAFHSPHPKWGSCFLWTPFAREPPSHSPPHSRIHPVIGHHNHRSSSSPSPSSSYAVTHHRSPSPSAIDRHHQQHHHHPVIIIFCRT